MIMIRCTRTVNRSFTHSLFITHWLQGTSAERSMGKRLQQSVVQRIQRFGSSSKFRRSILKVCVCVRVCVRAWTHVCV